MISQTIVLASNRQTTYGKPEQHRLHQGRLSWEKKYFVNCHHRRCAGEDGQGNRAGYIPWLVVRRHRAGRGSS